jgi:hypothetical protein
MGRKKQRPTWPEAKKLCRLNQLDIEMAKRLGFGPDALMHAVPSPKQRWKLPVKDWIHELHFKRFGNVLGEGSLDRSPAPPAEPPAEPMDNEYDLERWASEPLPDIDDDCDVPF